MVILYIVKWKQDDQRSVSDDGLRHFSAAPLDNYSSFPGVESPIVSLSTLQTLFFARHPFRQMYVVNVSHSNFKHFNFL